MRGDVRNVIHAMMRPSPSHTTCRSQTVATKGGTSVCPAEYSVARPYSASAPTESSRPLSSWRARDSTVRLGTWGGLRQRGTHIGQLQMYRRFGQGDGHLERLGRGIVRHGDFQRGRALLVDTEVVGDRARDERRDVGTDRKGTRLNS